MPTDAQLIWHLLATYLDSKLPFNPLCADAKPFSSLYYLEYPTKLKDGDLRKAKTGLYFLQKSQFPPHFQLAINGGSEILDVGPGRNNLFLSIILFVKHLQLKCEGKLGQVSLGESGLNLLWILDE